MEEREHGRTEGNRRKKKGVKSGEMCPEKDWKLVVPRDGFPVIMQG